MPGGLLRRLETSRPCPRLQPGLLPLSRSTPGVRLQSRRDVLPSPGSLPSTVPRARPLLKPKKPYTAGPRRSWGRPRVRYPSLSSSAIRPRGSTVGTRTLPCRLRHPRHPWACTLHLPTTLTASLSIRSRQRLVCSQMQVPVERLPHPLGRLSSPPDLDHSPSRVRRSRSASRRTTRASHLALLACVLEIDYF